MKKWKKAVLILLAASLVAVLMAACGEPDPVTPDRGSESSYSGTVPRYDSAPSNTAHGTNIPSSEVNHEQKRPSETFIPAGIPEASGSVVEENKSAAIDYSNTVDGYVMVDFLTDTKNPLKVQVAGPSTTYTYNIAVGEWTTFPLSDGDGSYKVTVYEGMGNNKYSTVLSATFQVALDSEFAPFLHANQYVNYCDAEDTMAKTAELTGGTTDTLEKVEKYMITW